jgi:2-keto-3-deoxy-L-fuconate dehydrogenase
MRPPAWWGAWRKHFDGLFRVNVSGVFPVTREAVPLSRAARGSIIKYGVGGRDNRNQAPLRRLRAHCICPGTIDTPFIDGILDKYHPLEKEAVRTQMEQRQPLGRLGRPDEITGLAVVPGIGSGILYEWGGSADRRRVDLRLTC